MYKQHIILDFEMNPVSWKNKNIRKYLGREIIEIGAVKLDENYNITDTFNCLVCPEYNTKITATITELTGIRTDDAFCAAWFTEAFEKFKNWIGNENTRIYSWSNSDLLQLEHECSYKRVDFPQNMKKWIDLQKLYPRLTGLCSKKNPLALKKAAEQFGVYVNEKMAHNALCDAEITTEILIPFLDGSYKQRVNTYKRCIEKKTLTSSMGEKYENLLDGLSLELCVSER